MNEVNRIGRDRCGSYLTASYGVTRSNKTYREPVIGYFFPSLDKDGWRVAPGWFDPGGDYLALIFAISGALSSAKWSSPAWAK